VAKTSKKPAVGKKSPMGKAAASKGATPKSASKPATKPSSKAPAKAPAKSSKPAVSVKSTPKPPAKAAVVTGKKKATAAPVPAPVTAKAKVAAPAAAPAKSAKPVPVAIKPAPVVVAKTPAPAAKAAPATGKSAASKRPAHSTSTIIMAHPKTPSANGSAVKPATKPAKVLSAKAARRAARAALPPIPVNPVTAVMATVKPGKNGAGLTPKELEFFRELLLAKRRELVGDMYSMEREALQRSGENLSNLPVHMADMGTDNYEQEFTLGLMEKDRQLLREINTALQKILDGRYGLCEGTGKVISKARLEVQPWAKFSIEHARKMEVRGVYR